MLFHSKKYLKNFNHIFNLPQKDFILYLLAVFKNDPQAYRLSFRDVQKICIVNDYHDVLPALSSLTPAHFLKQQQPAFQKDFHKNWLNLQTMGIQLAFSMNRERRQIYQKRLSKHEKLIQSKLQEIKLSSFGYHPHFFIPSHYLPLYPIQRINAQKNYIETISAYFHLQLTNFQRFSDLFPVQLFNLTDLPLIEECAYKYIIPHLSTKQISSIQKSLTWLCRFNFNPKFFMNFCFQKLKERIVSDEEMKPTELLSISNSLYILCRRMKYTEINQKKDVIIFVVKKCFKKIFHSEEQYGNFIQNIMESLRKKRKEIAQPLEQLNNVLKKEYNDKQKQRLEWMQTKFELKSLRLLLLSSYLQIEEHQILEKCFQYQRVKALISKNICLGDMMAQIIFINDRYNHFYLKSLIPEDIKCLLINTSKKYQTSFNNINSLSKQLKPVHLTRFTHIENLLCNHYFPHQNLFTSENERNVILSLLNDNECLGKLMKSQVKTTLAKKLSKQVKYKVSFDLEEYPYFIDAKIEDKEKVLEIVIKNSLFLNNRPKYKNQFVMNSDNIHELVKVLKKGNYFDQK